MIRFFFILLAVVAVVLAVLMSQTWLYVAAGVAVLAALALLVLDARRARRKKSPYTYEPRSRDDELSVLGITQIREKQEGAAPSSGRAAAPESPATEAAGTLHETPNGQAAEVPRDEDDAEALPLFLEALRAALGAHTVCLIAQEELALEYRVEAVAGVDAYLEPGGTFSTTAPLMTAGMSRRNLTFRSVGPEGVAREHLGYYAGDAPSTLRHVALAPLARPGHPTTWFLLADATEEVFLRRRAARALPPRFADLLALMLDVEAAEEGEKKAGDEAPPPVKPASRPAPAGDGAQAEASKPRPRREIIAEEMQRARAEGGDLALALLYLNRAEAVAARGPEPLAAAEEALRDALEAAAPDDESERVERFGELTYGVFLARPVDEAEAWALQLEKDLAHAEAPLDGGVSIGLAMLQERHAHAEDFRADATQALREAYDTGTCTILA